MNLFKEIVADVPAKSRGFGGFGKSRETLIVSANKSLDTGTRASCVKDDSFLSRSHAIC